MRLNLFWCENCINFPGGRPKPLSFLLSETPKQGIILSFLLVFLSFFLSLLGLFRCQYSFFWSLASLDQVLATFWSVLWWEEAWHYKARRELVDLTQTSRGILRGKQTPIRTARSCTDGFTVYNNTPHINLTINNFCMPFILFTRLSTEHTANLSIRVFFHSVLSTFSILGRYWPAGSPDHNACLLRR